MDDAGSSPVTEAYNAYMRSYSRRRYAERSQMAIELLGGVCAECGSMDDLQVDHVDPSTKLFDVKQLLYKRRLDAPEVLDELAKCQLLCRLCHEAKTGSERSVEHGGGLSGKKNCACSPCRARKAEYMRAYSRTRR